MIVKENSSLKVRDCLKREVYYLDLKNTVHRYDRNEVGHEFINADCEDMGGEMHYCGSERRYYSRA